MEMWDRKVCYSCETAPAGFGVDKKDHDDDDGYLEYADLEHDTEGWVRVPLCRDCVGKWDDDDEE